MKKILIIVIPVLLILTWLTLVIAIPNSIGKKITDEIKARGYIEYTIDEAKTLALQRCTQCHDTERILKYCHRCGPPFVAVIPTMKNFIEQYKMKESYRHVQEMKGYQKSVIAQVWNAWVGNWEGDFKREDMLKMIGNDKILLELYNTPVEKRKIEYAMKKKGDKAKGSYEQSGIGKESRNKSH
jgi:hypothetical protein